MDWNGLWNVENGIELLNADYTNTIGCLVRNYKPILMEIPNITTNKYEELKLKLNNAISKFESKAIKGIME